MRRIPRPSRAIDPSAALQSTVRPRISLSCHSAVPPCTHIRTSTAAFSSTPAKAFLLPAKQDKKKHQQFVRRWQKRLLGDSEPIGAHVDPYDPTSPVRIAPEEQGEYEEVLEEDGRRTREDNIRRKNVMGLKPGQYEPADRGVGLMRVGGEEWLQQKVEGDMAKEFEKLTLRTYTPMTLDMANEIETLTGTPYTLRDENLLMAQATHDVTARPYTKYHFGLHRKVAKLEDVRVRFAQAVAEVYALKEAGLDMDLAKLSNKGVYDIPKWVRDIKLHRTANGELALAYPKYKSAEEFLRVIQTTPDWESAPGGGEAEILLEEAEDLLESVLPSETVPTMDPATPEFKRAAVVKIDPEKKPFDFMSNRPVPRAKPVEAEKAEERVEAQVSVADPIAPTPSRLAELESAFATSQSALSELRHAVLQHRAQRIAGNLAGLQIPNKPSPSMIGAEEVKWRHVPLTDNAVKFAIFKRVYQLTGIRISDPHLSSSKTLGQIYDHVYEAAKPQPTSLYSAVHIEADKARRRAKNLDNPETAKLHRRADLGDLVNLGNVQIRKTKPTKTDIRTKTGMEKKIQYALYERGLLAPLRKRSSTRKKTVIEGTRDVPEFGKALSSRATNYATKRTRELRDEEEMNRAGA